MHQNLKGHATIYLLMTSRSWCANKYEKHSARYASMKLAGILNAQKVIRKLRYVEKDSG